jgi:hypothetical protein
LGEGTLPKRSRRYGVGKEIGGAVYVHRMYEEVLGDAVESARIRIPDGFDYAVVKYSCNSGAVSFVHSTDFDTADEPTVGDVWFVPVSEDPKFRSRSKIPFIYHHKWLMVKDDYNGFDVAASIRRSLQWIRLLGLDRTRIGRKDYWEANVEPRIGVAGRGEITLAPP